MKKLLMSALLALLLEPVFSQTNPAGAGTSTATQTTPTWDLYNSRVIEANKVPAATVQDFYKNVDISSGVTWYTYDQGYMAVYPGVDNTLGVLYDQNNKMTGKVKTVKTSKLPPEVSENLKKSYPDVATTPFVYAITSTNGQVMYVTNSNGQWSTYDQSGIPVKK